MFIFLVISKSSIYHETIKQACDSWNRKHSHVDFISSYNLLFGYFPENRPSIVFFDSDSYAPKELPFLISHLELLFSDSLLVVSSKKNVCFPHSPEHCYFEKYKTFSELKSYAEQLLVARRSQMIKIPQRSFFPLSKSTELFQPLTSPDSAFQLRYTLPTFFPRYQFFTCFITHQSQAIHNTRNHFQMIYDEAIHLTSNCFAHLLSSDCMILVFYELIDYIEDFIQRRNRLIRHYQANNEHKESLTKIHVGCIHSNFLGLYMSYYEAYETYYADKLYSPCTSFDEISGPNEGPGKTERLMSIEQMLRSNLRYENGNNIIEYLKLWFGECKRVEYDIRTIKMHLLSLHWIIKSIMFDMYKLKTKRIKRDIETSEILQIQTSEELEDYFYTWVTYSLNNISGKNIAPHTYVFEALVYIENHLMDDINLNSIAKFLSLNPSYFTTIFKREMDETFISYLTRQKMHKAASLLAGEWTISEIARMLKYKDLKHFRELFRNEFQCSPSEYRKMLNEKE